MFNTKGADVAHEKNVPKIFKCGEGSNPNPFWELNRQRELSRDYIILFFPYEYLLTAYIYKYFVLDYNKLFNCMFMLRKVNLGWLYNSILNIIDRHSIIVKVTSESKGIYWIFEGGIHKQFSSPPPPLTCPNENNSFYFYFNTEKFWSWRYVLGIFLVKALIGRRNIFAKFAKKNSAIIYCSKPGINMSTKKKMENPETRKNTR